MMDIAATRDLAERMRSPGAPSQRDRDLASLTPRGAARMYLDCPMWPGVGHAVVDASRMMADGGVPAVVVIHVDSGGGCVSEVYPIQRAVQAMQAGGAYVIAAAHGMMCSAAVWALAGCDEVVVSPHATVGSIGVVTYLYRRDADEDGVLVVSRGAPNKVPDAANDEHVAAAQARVDALASMMEADIMSARGISADALGAGGVFLGGDAVARGLADRVATDADEWIMLGGDMPAGYLDSRRRSPASVVHVASEEGTAAMSQADITMASMADELGARGRDLAVLRTELDGLRAECTGLRARLEQAESEVSAARAARDQADAERIVDAAIASGRVVLAARADAVALCVQVGAASYERIIGSTPVRASLSPAVGHAEPVVPVAPTTADLFARGREIAISIGGVK